MPSRPPTHRRTNQLTRWTNHAHSLTRSHGKDERKPWRKRTHGGGSHSCCSQRNIPCPREERSLFHSQSDRKQGNSPKLHLSNLATDGKDERKRTHGGGSHSCCSQRNIPCPRGGKIIVPFTERQEARELHRVGRFEPLQLSFPRVPFSSLLEYWKRDIWRGRSEMATNGFHPTAN